MLRRTIGAALAVTSLLGGDAALAAAGERAVPYWASISAGQARMRTGPGRQFPVSWLYQRADLPVKVVEVQPSWRKIQDVEGTTGWVMVNLLSDQRTAIVMNMEVALRDAPEPTARVVWRAAAGVVGRVTKCANGWCRFDVHGRNGYVEEAHLWGIDANEEIG